MLVKEIKLKCLVYPTEDLNKILDRLYKYFPGMKFSVKDDGIYKIIFGESKNIISLDYLRREIKKYDIKSLKKLLENEGNLKIYIDKLAIIKGIIHLLSNKIEPTMGKIEIEIISDNKNLVKNWLLL